MSVSSGHTSQTAGASAPATGATCPYCLGQLVGSVDVHLPTCPSYEALRPMTVDDMLARLGSAFRLADRL